MKVNAGALGEFTMNNCYTVHTDAPIEAMRDALVPHLTGELGHAVYINAVEYRPQQRHWLVNYVRDNPRFAAFCMVCQLSHGALWALVLISKALR